MDDADDDGFMAPIGGANSTPVPSSSDNKAPSTAVQLPDEEDDGFMSPVVAPKPISDGKDNTATNSTMGALTQGDDDDEGFMVPIQDRSADLLKLAEGDEDVSEKRKALAGSTASERRRVFDALTSGEVDEPVTKEGIAMKEAEEEAERAKHHHHKHHEKAVMPEDTRTATERAEDSLLDELKDKETEEWKPEYDQNQYMQHGLEKDRQHHMKEEDAKRHYHHDHQIDGKATYLISDKELKGFNIHHQHLAGHKEDPNKPKMHLDDGTYLGQRGEVVEGGAYQYDDNGKYISIDAGMQDDDEEPQTYTREQAGCLFLIGLPFIILYIIAITPYQCLRGDFHSSSGVNSLRESFKHTERSIKKMRKARSQKRAKRDGKVYVDSDN